MNYHTKLTIPECIERLSQPFLTDPDTTDTANIIKRPSKPQVRIERAGKGSPSCKYVILIDLHGQDFEIVTRRCKSLGMGLYSKLKDSTVQCTISCSMQANNSGGTDIECKNIGSLNPSILKAALIFVLIMVSLLANIQLQMSDTLRFLLKNISGLLIVLGIYYSFKALSITGRMNLTTFAAELLDAVEK